MVRGSEENCINGNKLNQQQTEDVVQFLFCFDRSFPFDLDELAQFVKELLLGEPVSSVPAQAKEVQGCGVKEAVCSSSGHGGTKCQGTRTD